MVKKPRPIVIIDTSVFMKDAMSKTQNGAASRILAILPATATIVLCDEILQELMEKCSQYLGWADRQVIARYGPILDVAVWLAPVEEQEWHRRSSRVTRTTRCFQEPPKPSLPRIQP